MFYNAEIIVKKSLTNWLLSVPSDVLSYLMILTSMEVKMISDDVNVLVVLSCSLKKSYVLFNFGFFSTVSFSGKPYEVMVGFQAPKVWFCWFKGRIRVFMLLFIKKDTKSSICWWLIFVCIVAKGPFALCFSESLMLVLQVSYCNLRI